MAQAQNDGFRFSVDVEIGVYTSGDPLPSIHKLPLTGTSGRLSIPLAEKPEGVVVDPRTVLLALKKFTHSLVGVTWARVNPPAMTEISMIKPVSQIILDMRSKSFVMT